MSGYVVRSERGIEFPLVSLGDKGALIPVLLRELDARFEIFREQNLARSKAREHRLCIACCSNDKAKLSSRKIGGSYSNYVASGKYGAEIVIPRFVEHVISEGGTGGYRLDDFTPDNSLGVPGIFC